jgi:hypothetical protein
MRTETMIYEVTSYVGSIRGFFKTLIILLVALFLTSCSSAKKKVVTYHVEFVVDGIPYAGTTKFLWYHAKNFSYSFSAIDLKDAFIRGTLKDGTKYVVYSYNIDDSKSGRIDVKSRVFLKTVASVVESFDNAHLHSSNHVVRVVHSYADIGTERFAGYNEAGDVARESSKLRKSYAYYYTIGANVTPFNDSSRAMKDYFNMGPPAYPVPQDYKPPEFRLHPGNNDIENSDADIKYDGNAYNVRFPGSGLASTWVMAPDVHVDGIGIAGRRPTIVINLNNENIGITSLETVSSAVDLKTGKAVDFYVDETSLPF